MRVLVAVASKYGSTREIARAVADELRRAGLDVDVRDASEADRVDGYDAAVLGSAVYMGQWLEPARALVQGNAEALASRPTWLFSSGPIGGKPIPEQAVDVSVLLEASGAREHRLFGGRLDKGRLGFAERALTLALRAPEGDFRDWEDIRGWARQIAASLRAPGAGEGTPG